MSGSRGKGAHPEYWGRRAGSDFTEPALGALFEHLLREDEPSREDDERAQWVARSDWDYTVLRASLENARVEQEEAEQLFVKAEERRKKEAALAYSFTCILERLYNERTVETFVTLLKGDPGWVEGLEPDRIEELFQAAARVEGTWKK